MDAVVNLNGRQYSGITLFICRYDPTAYGPILPALRSYFESHFDGTTVDLSNLRANSFPLNLSYFRDFEFCLCFLAATFRRTGKSVTILNLESNKIRNLNALDQVRIFLPTLQAVRIGGNPIDDAHSAQRLQQNAGIQIITDLDSDSGISDSVESFSATVSAPTVADARIECLTPFVEHLIKLSSSDIAQTSALYATDACFSVLCGKLSSEWHQLFPGNRNLTHAAAHAIPQVTGASAIARHLKSLFPTGIRIEGLVIRASVVSNLFYSVNLYGTATADGRSLEMMRALVVVGRDGRLQIANDVLSLRYPERTERH
jgi:hypothetical protein